MTVGHSVRPGGAPGGGRCVVGLCGGVGTGKSTAAAWLRGWGVAHCDVDALGHQVLGPGQPALSGVIARFGSSVLDATGALDRKALGRTVFGDPAALADLNAITHPQMIAAVDDRLAHWRLQRDAAALFVVDAALLFDMGLDRRCDETLAIAAPPHLQVARLMANRGLDEAQARARVTAQPAVAHWRQRATTVIDNDGTLGQFAIALARWWRDLARRRGLDLVEPGLDA